MTKTEQTDIVKTGNLIRAAWNSGKKEITIDGHVLKIQRSDHRVAVRVGEKTEHRVESWLVASPKDRGTFVPVYNVELTPGKNSRVTGQITPHKKDK